MRDESRAAAAAHDARGELVEGASVFHGPQDCDMTGWRSGEML
jgi:hypothetical protein